MLRPAAQLICLTVLFPTAAFGALNFAKFDASGKSLDLNRCVYYYVEEYNEQLPHEALELLKAGYFTQAKSARLSLGYMQRAVWVAVPIETRDSAGDRLVLEIASLIDSIQLSVLNERGLIVESFLTGRNFTADSRPIKNHNFVFPIRIGNSQQGYIFMRLTSQGSMLVPLEILAGDAFNARDRNEQLIFGLYFGLMVVMIVYNFFLYTTTRERSYAFYVFYILFFTAFQFSLWGFMHEIVLPDMPRLAKYAQPISLHLATIFQLFFATQFFNAQALIPFAYRLSGYLSFATFVSLIAGGFLPYRIFIAAGIFTGVTASLLNAAMAFLLLFKNMKAARLFLLAYTVLIVGAVLLALRNVGVLNYSIITTYAAQLGSAMQAILLSLALADRINITRNEKEAAQRHVLLREQELSRAFQHFVPRKILELTGETDFARLELGNSTTCETAILCSHIRNFTALSEKMSPEDIFRFLNAYMKRIGPIIRQHGGFIDKFIGDKSMALFPTLHDAGKDGAVGATQAALRMREELRQYNEHRAQRGYQSIEFAMGIHFGTVQLGTIGDSERWEGTVIGDAVNLAARIASVASMFSAPIVVSHAILKKLDKNMERRELDTMCVNETAKAVTMYEIFGET